MVLGNLFQAGSGAVLIVSLKPGKVCQPNWVPGGMRIIVAMPEVVVFCSKPGDLLVTGRTREIAINGKASLVKEFAAKNKAFFCSWV